MRLVILMWCALLRQNGLRDDIAREVEALKPAFLRFPGGNNM
jgi:alpha-N-arabinofuranosidase